MPVSKHEDMVAELLIPEISDLLSQRKPAEARAALAELRDPEIADVIAALRPPLDALALRVLPRDRAADAFAYLDHDRQEALIEALNDEHVAAIVNEMDPDDRVELLEDAPDALAASLLAMLEPAERHHTQRALAYPEESVGRLATPDYLTLRPRWTVAEALEHLRRDGAGAETLHTLYVIDEAGRLIDHVRLRQLVLADPRARCDDLGEGNVVCLGVSDDREEAVRVMERYDLPVLPVVDDAGVLVGVVTFDDVADVASEEVTEDIHKLGGMEALDTPYASASLLTMVRKRGVWLMVLFLGGLFTIAAMDVFHDELQRYAILALFVPLIIASGGNSGTQAATLIVRSLATGDIKTSDWLTVLRRELASGLVLGSLLGVLAMIVATTLAYLSPLSQMPDSTFPEAMHMGFAIGTAVVGVVVTGIVVGAMLPVGLEAIGLDPATCSTPFVATVVDVAGLVIYFSVAVLLLGI